MMFYEQLRDQVAKSKASESGCSFYGKAALCGMQSHLSERYPYEEPDHEGPTLTATGKPKVNGKKCGAYFHAMQERWRIRDLPADIGSNYVDYDYEVALNSFLRYQIHFDQNRHNLGRVRSVEKTLPENDEQRERILEFTGGYPLTARMDLVTDISNEDVHHIAIQRQLSIPGPGPYIVDYKLIASISSITMWQYSYDFQQLAYPVIWNICFPDNPVRGMLTEAMARVQKPEARHFGLYLAYADKDAAKIVRDSVRNAAERRKIGAANPSVCIGKYGPCYFLTNGVCPRHGVYSDFTFEDR